MLDYYFVYIVEFNEMGEQMYVVLCVVRILCLRFIPQLLTTNTSETFLCMIKPPTPPPTPLLGPPSVAELLLSTAPSKSLLL